MDEDELAIQCVIEMVVGCDCFVNSRTLLETEHPFVSSRVGSKPKPDFKEQRTVSFCPFGVCPF